MFRWLIETRYSDDICSGTFTFILGFTGTTVVPRFVMPALIRFLEKIYIRNEPLWESFSSDQTFLKSECLSHTPVVLIYGSQENITSRQLVYSLPKSRPWGLLPRCGRPDCQALPGSYKISAITEASKNHPRFKFRCLQCGWNSSWVPRPDWVHELQESFFFWTEYPLSVEQQHYFLFKTMDNLRSSKSSGLG